MSFHQRITTYFPLPLWHLLGLLSLVIGLTWIVAEYRNEHEKKMPQDSVTTVVPSSDDGLAVDSTAPPQLLAMSPAAEKKWTEIMAQAEQEQTKQTSEPTANKPLLSTPTVSAPIPPVDIPAQPVTQSLPKEKVSPVAVPVLKEAVKEKPLQVAIKKPLPEIRPTEDVQTSAIKPQEHYSIQLLSSQNRAAIQALLDKNSGVKQLKLMTIKQQGQERYLLLYGDFSSRPAAVSAITQIPASLIQGTPWIKSMRNNP